MKDSVKNVASTTDEEMEPLPTQPNGTGLAQTPTYLQYFDRLLIGIEPRWRNWIIRSIFTFVMIGSFIRVLSMGQLALSVTIFSIQIKCFQEIITIGYVVYKSDNLPWFRVLSWYFLLIYHFAFLLNQQNFLQPLVTYHRMIAFLLYISGFVAFVLSLKKTYYLKQFTLFGYTHLALMIFVVPFHAAIQNTCAGMIWFIFPAALIICNDIMAYVFGFFIGRTPLTKLSPKKTWEGFIGGGISTFIFGFIIAGSLCQYPFLISPTEQVMNMSIYQKAPDQMPLPFSVFKKTLHLYPFQLHSLVLSLFASSIGPFGGFFASGFKRAFRIKDFSTTIPGHGGFVVR